MALPETIPHPNRLVPKICGFDVELANVDPARRDKGTHAAWALLRALAHQENGIAAGPRANRAQDAGRVFLPSSGSSPYVDLCHLELAGAEVRGAWDFCALFHSLLELAREAAQTVNARRDEDQWIRVHANNADGHGASWGGHCSFLINRRTSDRLFLHRAHELAWLASAQVSSIIFAGAGKVGSENGAPAVGFQLSQRADFFECLVAEWTTFRRPLVNSRMEPLASGDLLARLHCIFHDTCLSHTAIILRVGFMQLILAMLEAGYLNASLMTSMTFEDPVPAVRTFSHDPTLAAKARLLTGQELTALEHQYLLLDHVGRFVESGGADGIVPRAGELVTLWENILENLACQNWDYLARRLDWVAKHQLISNAAAGRNLGWEAPELKVLDHAWSDLEEGLYFDLERAGALERMVSPEAVARFRSSPPEDTRAYARTCLLRRFDRKIRYIDWDYITVRHRGSDWNIPLPDPAEGTRADLGGVEVLDDDELLVFFGAHPAPPAYYTTTSSTTNKTYPLKTYPKTR
jgi:hypothetical protein